MNEWGDQSSSTIYEEQEADGGLDDLAEFQGLLKAQGVSSNLHPSEHLEFWLKLLIHCSYAVLGLGVVEFVIVVLFGTESFVGSFAASMLGVLGLASSALAVLALRGSERLKQRGRTGEGLDLIELFFHVGTLLWVAFFVFSVAILALSPLFERYVETHWEGNVQDAFPQLSAEEAKAHVSDTVLAIGGIALVSSACLGAALVASVFVRPRGVFNDQAFLWVTLASGCCGSVLIGIATYTMHHESDVPVSASESWLVLALGIALFGLSVMGIFRMFLWRPKEDAGHSSDGRGGISLHSAALVVATAASIWLCAQYYWRAGHVEAFLKEDSEFARYGLYTMRGDDNLHKLHLSAQIQSSLMGTLGLTVTLYALLELLFASRLDEIMLDMDEDRQSRVLARG